MQYESEWRAVGGRFAQSSRSEGRAIPSARLDLPDDLRSWAASSTLQTWVEREVGKLDWEDPPAGDYARKIPDNGPRFLLTLTTFAYACGVFSSLEISRLCRSDRVFCSLCEEQAPFPQDLQNFRRKNRHLIEAALAGVFLEAQARRWNKARANVPQEVWHELCECAVERLDIARHLDTEG